MITHRTASRLRMMSLMVAGLGMMGSGGNIGTAKTTDAELIERTRREIMQAKDRAETRAIQNGAKRFWYKENSLIARDQANADRKAKNRGWL